jgi:hypothetical protein
MKVAVIGSRSFTDEVLLENELNGIKNQIAFVITGGAKGADAIAEKWALKNNIPTVVFQPDWQTYGKAAGIIRNKQIIETCDCCFAFWDNQSKGTLFSINYCNKISKPIKVLNFIPAVSDLK